MLGPPRDSVCSLLDVSQRTGRVRTNTTVSRGDERVVARAPARPRRRLEVALVVRMRRGDLSGAAARFALALDFDAFRGRWCRGRPARRRPTRRPGGAPRVVGRRGARDGALRVLGRAEIRLGAVGAQFLDLRRSTSESVQLVPRRNSIHARFAHNGCDFALVCGIAPEEVRQPAAQRHRVLRRNRLVAVLNLCSS